MVRITEKSEKHKDLYDDICRGFGVLSADLHMNEATIIPQSKALPGLDLLKEAHIITNRLMLSLYDGLNEGCVFYDPDVKIYEFHVMVPTNLRGLYKPFCPKVLCDFINSVLTRFTISIDEEQFSTPTSAHMKAIIITATRNKSNRSILSHMRKVVPREFKVAIPSQVTEKWLNRYAPSEVHSKYIDKLLVEYIPCCNQCDAPAGYVQTKYDDKLSIMTAGELIEELKKYPAEAKIYLKGQGYAYYADTAYGNTDINISHKPLRKIRNVFEKDYNEYKVLYDALNAIATHKIGKTINEQISYLQVHHTGESTFSLDSIILVKHLLSINKVVLKKVLCEMYDKATDNDVDVKIKSVDDIPGSIFTEIEFTVSKK